MKLRRLNKTFLRPRTYQKMKQKKFYAGIALGSEWKWKSLDR